jgi:hypothetical protein
MQETPTSTTPAASATTNEPDLLGNWDSLASDLPKTIPTASRPSQQFVDDCLLKKPGLTMPRNASTPNLDANNAFCNFGNILLDGIPEPTST